MPFSFAHIFLDTLKVFVFSVTLLYTFQKSKCFQSFRIFVYNTQAGGEPVFMWCGINASIASKRRAKRVINSWVEGVGRCNFWIIVLFSAPFSHSGYHFEGHFQTIFRVWKNTFQNQIQLESTKSSLGDTQIWKNFVTKSRYLHWKSQF